ncbi:hypothetical protein B7494_g2985 [Chlorociboria aeruginascens]|nr:hypothetical protein B7494_g2985 [Chlorociboria aeruginascens]
MDSQRMLLESVEQLRNSTDGKPSLFTKANEPWLNLMLPTVVSSALTQKYRPKRRVVNRNTMLDDLEVLFMEPYSINPPPTSEPGQCSTFLEDPHMYLGLKMRQNSIFAPPFVDSKDKCVTPIGVLSRLTTSIISDSIRINFDYVSLHERCTLFLRALAVDFEAEMAIFDAFMHQNKELADSEGRFRTVMMSIFYVADEAHARGDFAKEDAIYTRIKKIMVPFCWYDQGGDGNDLDHKGTKHYIGKV